MLTAVGGLLFVCQANRARSPIAELTARCTLAAQPGGAGITVGSAGTWTPGGEPMIRTAAEEAARRGLDPSGFVSRPLTDDLIGAADVVLLATRALRDEVVAARPALLRRAYTWRELAWVLTNVQPDWTGVPPADRPARLPAVVVSARGRFPALPGPDLDVDDPAGRSPEVMRVAADQTVAAVVRIAEALCR
jgi:protein-tyrosine phosphatase